jgi:ABC-type multidrug transport system ATPase subunit
MLQIRKVNKTLGKQQVLSGVTLTLDAGTCCGLIGKNGAGKTTLLNIIYGLTKPDAGSLELKDSKGNSLKYNEGHVGYSSGHETLINDFTGFEYLRFICHLYEASKSVSDQNIVSLFTYFFEEEKDINKRIADYSYGMKQKISICGAIIHSPAVLLLDEPFTGLDPFSADRLIEFLRVYGDNRVVLLSSHDLSLVSKIATHISILDQKTIVYSDTIEQFTQGGFKTIDQSLFEMIKPKEFEVKNSLKFILDR